MEIVKQGKRTMKHSITTSNTNDELFVPEILLNLENTVPSSEFNRTNDTLFLTNLPTDIIITILSILPIRTIISCKCVCKSWFELLESPEFVESHLSKSVPGLIVNQVCTSSGVFRTFQFNDELDLENHELHYVPVTEFDCRAFISSPGASIRMEGSADGLLFFGDILRRPDSLYICNPITREYINLPHPEGIFHDTCLFSVGFGVSKKTDQYKVVMILQECVRDPDTSLILRRISKSECRVYTLGTRSWRSVPPDSSHLYNYNGSSGIFLNGNLHWLVIELNRFCLISCFDLEMELFKAFTLPRRVVDHLVLGDLRVLGDHLCLCGDNPDDEIVIWVMKEYGVEKSWTKEIVISKPGSSGEWYSQWCVVEYPIKVFRDGDILLFCENSRDIYYYSSKTKTTHKVDILRQQSFVDIKARLHVSSFLSLKRFAMENVAKF